MDRHFSDARHQAPYQERVVAPDFVRANTWDNGFRNDGRGYNRVEPRLQGYVLARAEPHNGNRPTWSRATRQPLPGSEQKLEAMSRNHRTETRKGPMTHFEDCTPTQQALINRLRETIQLSETDRNAEWVLDCVKKVIRAKRVSFFKEIRETRKLVVIFRKQDRFLTSNRQRMPSEGLEQYPLADIIDINEPVNLDGLGLGLGSSHDLHANGRRGHLDGLEPRDGFREQDRQFRQEPFYQQENQQQYFDPMQGGAQMHDGHFDSGMQQDNPVDVSPEAPPKKKGKKGKKKKAAEEFGNFDQNALYEDLNGGQQQQPGHAPWDGNPFQPNNEFNQPGAFDMPAGMGSQNHQAFSPRCFTPDHRHARSRSRSRSRERRREADEEARRYQEQRERDRLERKVETLNEKLQTNEKQYFNDKLNEVMNKVDKWNVREHRDSSSSERSVRNDGFWSPAASGGSFTPPSSPPLSAVLDVGGPLGRSKSYRHNKDAGGYRSKRYYDRDGRTVIEPHYSTGQRRISYGDEYRRSNDSFGRGPLPPIAPEARDYRRREGRPILHQSRTWDDYPNAPVATDDFDVVDMGRGREYERRVPRSRRGAVFDERDRRPRSRRDGLLW